MNKKQDKKQDETQTKQPVEKSTEKKYISYKEAANNIDQFISLVSQQTTKDNSEKGSLDTFIKVGKSEEGKEALNHISDLDKQMSILEKFRDGKIDYATMRTFCG